MSDLSSQESSRIRELELLCNVPFDTHDLSRRTKYEPAMQQVQDYFKCKLEFFSGYQANQDLNYSEELKPFLDMQINNIGDAYKEGNFRMSNKFQERAVLNFFSKLWGATQPSRTNELPHEKDLDTEQKVQDYYDEAWGYVLSMGCTEGNMYGLRNARDYLKGKFLTPILSGDHVTKLEENAEASIKPHVFIREAKRTGKQQSYRKTVCGVDLAQAQRSSTHDMAGLIAEAGGDVPSLIALDHSNEPILLYSKSSHYSIAKIRNMLELDSPFTISHKYPTLFDQELSEQIDIDEDGTVNIQHLVKTAKMLVDRGFPIILSLNYGTTFTGAHDNVEAIFNALNDAGCLAMDEWVHPPPNGPTTTPSGHVIPHHRFQRSNFWIHVDGALGAFYGAYFSRPDLRPVAAKVLGIEEKALPRLPRFDFGLGHIMSIAMSGHKVMGAPFPTGIVMTKRKFLLDFQNVKYIGAADTTLAGSRSGLAVMVMWNYLAKRSVADHIEKFYRLLKRAEYVHERLDDVFKQRLAELMNSKAFSKDEAEFKDEQKTSQTFPQPIPETYYPMMTRSARLKAKAGSIEKNSLTEDKLNELKVTYRAPNALSVIFPRPSRSVIEKFSLSCDEFAFPGSARILRTTDYGTIDRRVKTPVAHLFCMESFNDEIIDALIETLKTDPGVIESLKKMIGWA